MKLVIAALFLLLVVLAVARWIVDGARWVVAPRRQPVRVAAVARSSAAK